MSAKGQANRIALVPLGVLKRRSSEKVTTPRPLALQDTLFALANGSSMVAQVNQMQFEYRPDDRV